MARTVDEVLRTPCVVFLNAIHLTMDDRVFYVVKVKAILGNFFCCVCGHVVQTLPKISFDLTDSIPRHRRSVSVVSLSDSRNPLDTLTTTGYNAGNMKAPFCHSSSWNRVATSPLPCSFRPAIVEINDARMSMDTRWTLLTHCKQTNYREGGRGGVVSAGHDTHCDAAIYRSPSMPPSKIARSPNRQIALFHRELPSPANLLYSRTCNP